MNTEAPTVTRATALGALAISGLDSGQIPSETGR